MRKGFIVGMLALAGVAAAAQEREDRTLLTQEQMNAIINEASGERAMHHVLELVGYQRVRLPVEYEGNFRESEVMARFARQYGYSSVVIEKFGQTNAAGQPATAWQPTQGELWMTTPKAVKLYDIHDIALSLASLNANGDISGELVDGGQGRAQDRVLGAHHRHLGKADLGAAQPAVRAGEVVTVAVLDVRAQRAHGVDVQVDRSAADAVAAWVAHDHVPEARQ